MSCTDAALFDPIPKPGPNDWLANHKEKGQTFVQYVKSGAHLPDSKRNVIYFLPLSFMQSDTVPADVLQDLSTFASDFFAMQVTILSPSADLVGKVHRRTNSYTHKLQVSLMWCAFSLCKTDNRVCGC